MSSVDSRSRAARQHDNAPVASVSNATAKLPTPHNMPTAAAQSIAPQMPDAYPPPAAIDLPLADEAIAAELPPPPQAATTDTPDRLVGTTIDNRYVVESRLARGGMATVYKARDTRLDRHVALKIMYPHLAESADFVARFRREARAAAQLAHPGVVAVFDQGTTEGSSYLVMELVDGPNLRHYLLSRGCLSVGESLRITSQILSALAAAHRSGLVHRDVKPENVLLLKDGTVKVADFGLARAASEVTAATTGSILGTVAYLSPETVLGTAADARVDVYATGIMLYEMLAGVTPFSGDAPIQIAYAHVNQDIPHLRDSQPWVPPAVDNLISSLTQRDAAHRPVDGDAAWQVLEEVRSTLNPEEAELRGSAPASAEPLSDLAAAAVMSPTLAEVPLPTLPNATASASPSKKRRWPFLLAALFTVLALLATVAWYLLLGPGAYKEVPDLYNQEWATAAKRLKNQEIEFTKTEEFSDTVSAGNITRTDPASGKDLWRFSSLTIFVSKGIEMLTAPALLETTSQEATQKVRDAGFGKPEVSETYHEEIAAGKVVAQDPEPNARVAHNTVIKIVVSKGREPVAAPAVTGKLRDEAVQVLQQSGLRSELTEEYSNEVPRGRVISQSVPATTTLYRNDTITLVVSKGPRTVVIPKVAGKSEAEATAILQDLGLQVEVLRVYSIVGIVAESNPPAGTELEVGSTVTLKMI